MTQCQIVLEVSVADCSTQLVQRRKTLVVRTLVVCVIARQHYVTTSKEYLTNCHIWFKYFELVFLPLQLVKSLCS